MKRYGIERQTLLIALIPIVVMSLLLEGHFIYMRLADMDSALLERAQLMAHQLASSSEYAVFSGNTELLKQEADAAARQQDVRNVLVLDASGKALMRAGGQVEYVAMTASVSIGSRFYQDDDAMLLYEPIVPTQIRLDEVGGGSSSATVVDHQLGAVVMEISKRRLNSQKQGMLLFNMMVTLLVLAVTLLVARWVARGITHPIMGMSLAIRRIEEGDLSARIAPQPRVHELSELATGINRMAQQLQQDRSMLQLRIDDATHALRLKKEEAENASRDKSRFLAAASHDLRQPMHALGLYVEVLRREVTEPEQVKVVSRIGESIDALSGLLNSLLDISKLDAGVVFPEVGAFSLHAMLTRMAQDYAPVAADKNLRLRIRTTSAEVVSDPVLLERILLNLLSNAMRYTAPGGSVLVACRRRGGNLHIEVRDNGGGIPAAEQQNIFREFFQLENSGRDRSKGLGLGLAIVERLAKLLGHGLMLRSAPGKGSLFAIELPLATPDERRSTEPPALTEPTENNRADLEQARVLLVDDDALVLAGTQSILGAWGCKVCAVATLREAREQCAVQVFDLVICDHRLPDGSGLELIAWLEADCSGRISAILVSGDTALEVLQQVMASGHQLLHKPVRPAKLRSLMLFLLARAASAQKVGLQSGQADATGGAEENRE